jgi:hypothetical protein
MSFHPEQTVGFLPLLIVDVSMEHSHRRTAVTDESEPSATEVAKPGTPRRLVGFFLTKALAPLRLAGAR